MSFISVLKAVVLNAINAKKVGSPQDWVIEDDVALTSSKSYTYNIAELLENVKAEFNDVFMLMHNEKQKAEKIKLFSAFFI